MPAAAMLRFGPWSIFLGVLAALVLAVALARSHAYRASNLYFAALLVALERALALARG